MKNKKKFTIYCFLVLFFLLFLKIDYRFIDDITCCGDDFDYYIHAKTIAIDNDLDYSNNLENDPYFYKFNDVIAPKGFIGTGIMSAPFLYFGSVLNKYIVNNNFFNYEIIFYSLSSIFYFLLSIVLLNNAFERLNLKIGNFFVFLIFFGSGLPYYAFERYSMTHSYEVFINVLIFTLVVALHKETNNRKVYFLIIGILLSICLGLLIRWTNYYILFLPFLYKNLLGELGLSTKKMFRFPITYIGTALSFYIFYWLSKSVYGRFILDPRKVYGEKKEVAELISIDNGFVNTLISYASNIVNILFGNEFGLFWTSPITFLFVPVILIFFFERKYKIFSILLLIFIQIFGIVIIWQSTASSYGYRYVFSLIPIALISFVILNKYGKYDYLKFYLYPFSIFSMFSVLFFETNINTQLSLIETANSFGRITKYTQPNYVTGYLSSFSNPESYQIIFLTSVLGAFVFKILQSVVGYKELLELLNTLGLPITNTDFQNFYINLERIEYLKFITLIVFFILFSKKIYRKKNNN